MVSERYVRIFVVLLVLIVSMQLAYSLDVDEISGVESFNVSFENVSSVVGSGVLEGERVVVTAFSGVDSFVVLNVSGKKGLNVGLESITFGNTSDSLEYEMKSFSDECVETCDIDNISVEEVVVEVFDGFLYNLSLDVEEVEEEEGVGEVPVPDVPGVGVGGVPPGFSNVPFEDLPRPAQIRLGERPGWNVTVGSEEVVEIPGTITSVNVDGLEPDEIFVEDVGTLEDLISDSEEFLSSRSNAGFEGISGFGSGRETVNVWHNSSEEVTLSFETEEPILASRERESAIDIVVSSETSYKNISVEYEFSEPVRPDLINLYRVTNGREEISDVGYNLNSEFMVESIEWIVPSLSNEEYEITTSGGEGVEAMGGNQYFWSAEYYDVGDVPDDAWIARSNIDNFSIQQDTNGRKYMLVEAPNSQRSSLEFLPGSTSDHVEVWGEISSSSSNFDGWLFGRGTNLTDVNSLNAVRIDWIVNNGVDRLSEYVNGNFNSIVDKSLTGTAGDIVQVRGGFENNTIRGKWWLSNESEPSNWQLETTSSVVGSGNQGVGHWRGDDFKIYRFGVGTEGESAPTSQGIQVMSSPDCTNYWNGFTQPYEISNVSDLQCMKDELDADYVLVNDIDASDTVNWNGGDGFTPVGDSTTSFTGSLDGDGFIITDLFVDNLGLNRGGLFGETNGAVIENFGLKNVSITVDLNSAGVIGVMNDGLLQNVFAKGSVESIRGDAAGLIATQNEGSLNNTYAVVNATGVDASGLVARAELGGSGFILDSYAAGFISAGGTENGLVASFTALDPGQFQSLYWDTNTSGTSTDAVGTEKTTSEMKDLSTFNTDWDISDLSTYNGETWFIDDGVDYPRLFHELEVSEDNAFILNISTVAGGETIQLPLVSSGTYDFLVDWGDGTINGVDNHTSSGASHQYSSLGTYEITISGDLDRWSFGDVSDSSNNVIDVLQWGNISWSSWEGMFQGAENLDISASDAPDLSNVQNMNDALRDTGLSNENLSHWDTSSVTNMQRVFYRFSSTFNGDISGWDTSNVVNMSQMFYFADFNGDISSWDVGSVQDMFQMFFGSNFNQSLNAWDVSSVQDFSQIFRDSDFNQDVSQWNVSSAIIVDDMFSFTSFDGDVSNWDVSSVESMVRMFYNSNFDGDLGDWNVSNVNNFQDFFGFGSSLSTNNYDSLLIGWSELGLESGLSFDGFLSEYCSGEDARQSIIDNYSWTFNDGGKSSDCPEIGSVSINSSNGLNSSTENLTAHPNNLTPSGANVSYDWRLNGSSLAKVNVPFMKNNSYTSTQLPVSLTTYNNEFFVNTSEYELPRSLFDTGRGFHPYFDTNSSLEMKDNTALRSVFDPYGSISFWIKPNITSGNQLELFRSTGPEGTSFYVEFNADDDKLQFNKGFGGGFTSDSSDDNLGLMDGNWHHVVILFNSSDENNLPEFYIDGTLVASSSDFNFGTIGSSNPSGNLLIGQSSFSQYRGSLDNVLLYDVLLGEDQITLLYEERYDEISSDLTSVDDTWSVFAKPYNEGLIGDGVLSGNISIVSAFEQIVTQVGNARTWSWSDSGDGGDVVRVGTPQNWEWKERSEIGPGDKVIDGGPTSFNWSET